MIALLAEPLITTLDDDMEKAIRIYSRRLIATAGFTEQDLDDIRQEMRLELMRRLPSFNPRRAKRSTFIARVLERKGGQLVRHRNAEKRDFRREKHSLNDSIADGDGRKVMRVQLLSDADRSHHMKRSAGSPIERCIRREAFAVAKACLTESQRMICERLMHVSRVQMCRETGMSPRELREQIRQIRQCLEHTGLRAYLEN